MAPRRDPLDASLIRLCSLAEQTTVLLREVRPAREGFRAFRFDPDALADALTTLAARGRAVHSDRLDAHRDADVAREEARALAEEAYAIQAAFRLRLTTAATLASDPVSLDDLADTRRRLALASPRLTGALDQYRRLRDHLARPTHAVRHHPTTATIPAEVDALVDRLARAVATRDDALRTRRRVVRHAEAAWTDLRTQLRTIRQMAEIVATLPEVPAALFRFLQRRPARPSTGPTPSSDPGEMSSDPGATSSDCGQTSSDPGKPSSDPGDMSSDPGTPSSDPGTPSNRPFPPPCTPDDA